MTDELPDLYAIFEATEHSAEGGQILLEVRCVGQLLTDGSVVACDPFADHGEAFARRASAGAFDVELLLASEAGQSAVALARVVFQRKRPARFELAVRPGQDPRSLAPGQHFGYGVDSGTGCFATPKALDTFDADALLAALHAHGDTWRSAAAVQSGRAHELIAFSSGDGDGVYASWYGLDERDSPTCLVTDFKLLTLRLPELRDDSLFRRENAERAAEKLLAVLPRFSGSTQAEAYRAASELWASPPDAAHLIEKFFERYLAASGDSEHLLGEVVERLLTAPEAQRRLAPQLGTVDPARWIDRLKRISRTLDGALLDVVWQCWDAVGAGARRQILHLALQAPPTSDRAPRFQHAAVESLRSSDVPLAEEALAVLSKLVSTQLLAPLDGEARAAVERLTTQASREFVRQNARKVLVFLDANPGTPS